LRIRELAVSHPRLWDSLIKMNLDFDGWLARRSVRMAIWAAVCALCTLKFCYLSADFPNYSPWMIDQAKFTDEGWWGSAAVMHFLTGHWYVAGDYNPGVALPVWPLLLGTLFHFTGVSVVAARALNVVISIATLGVVFALVRRYTSMNAETPALLAVLLLSASPFAFVFSRLAILDTLVVFEFCVLLLVASYASARRVWLLAVLALLITAMMLTKTTAVLLAPAVFWVAWSAMGRKAGGLLRTTLAVVVLPAALFKGYAALVSALGYGADYKYFFDVNALTDIEWRQAVGTLSELMQNCFWIDRVLYPVGLLILVLTVAWKRKLWSNPLFAASWVAIAAQAVFIFSRQDDYAPRYFLVMLTPLVWIVVLTFGELIVHAPKAAIVLLVAMIGAVVANVVTIGQFLTHRDYDFRDAANSIRNIVRSHPEQKALMLGVSGPQISLMTGIPAINDGFGTQDMAEKVARYQPGWYLAWSDAAPEKESFLSGFQLEKVASYPVFDDDDRNLLILYKLIRKMGSSFP
jgi:dolichyl-phosphate-mannose-protein mannosyltransferase